MVVGVDGSDPANEALDWAIGEARVRGARLRVVAVWTYPWIYGGAEGAIPPMAFQDMTAEMETMLKTLIAERSEAVGDTEVSTAVHEGACAPILLDEAKHADLLVVGSRGSKIGPRDDCPADAVRGDDVLELKTARDAERVSLSVPGDRRSKAR